MEPNDTIRDFLTDLIGSIDRQNLARAEAVMNIPQVQKAREQLDKGDFRGFYFALLYPLSNMVDGLLTMQFPHNSKAQFLFRNSSFVENHLKKLFETYEGLYACADKARTVMRELLRFFMTGEEICFHYEGTYTYHLPNRVLTSHGEIVRYFNAVERLFYGQYEDYLTVMNGMAELPRQE